MKKYYVNSVLITPQSQFDEKGQTEAWKNEVARELNVLLGRAQFFKETSNDESDKEAEEATMSIVARVAEFEEIELKDV